MSRRAEKLLTSRFETVRELLAKMMNAHSIHASSTGYAEALARWMTNVLDSEQLTRKQAGLFYQQRWRIEILFRSLKQTWERSCWRSRVPRTVLAEQISMLLGFWIQQPLSHGEFVQSKIDPRLWSPVPARNCTRRMLRRVLQRTLPLESWLEELGLAIRDCYVRRSSKQIRT